MLSRTKRFNEIKWTTSKWNVFQSLINKVKVIIFLNIFVFILEVTQPIEHFYKTFKNDNDQFLIKFSYQF